MAYCSATDISNFIGTKVFSATTRPTDTFVDMIISNVTMEINTYTANAFEPTLIEVAETRNAEQALIDAKGRMNIKLNHRNLVPFSGIESIIIVNEGTGYTTMKLEVVGDCVRQATVEPILEEETTPAPDPEDPPVPTGTYKIVGYTITDAGEGYKETPTITVTGDGTDAELTATLDGCELEVVIGGEWVNFIRDKTMSISGDYYFDYSSGILFLKRFPDMGNRNIKVKYKYGNYDTVPSDIKMAAILLASAHIISQDDRAFLTVDGSQVTPTNQQKADMWHKEAYNLLRRRAEFNVII